MLNFRIVVKIITNIFGGNNIYHYLCIVFLKDRNRKATAKGDSFRSYLTYKLQSQS